MYRKIYNPVEKIMPPDDLSIINRVEQYSLQMIDKRYVNPVAKRKFEKVPKEYEEYLKLFMVVRSIKYKTANKTLLLLLNIVEDALVAAINTYTIYGENLMFRIDKINLEKKIEDILSNKNTVAIQMMNTSGQLKITKVFKLKAIFNYYILLFGMPLFGEGFDPIKMSFLEETMKKNGINPYK
jgi:hypothetical protein